MTIWGTSIKDNSINPVKNGDPPLNCQIFLFSFDPIYFVLAHLGTAAIADSHASPVKVRLTPTTGTVHPHG